MTAPLPNKTLLLPPKLTAEHATEFPNGVLWCSWARAEAGFCRVARKERYWAREYRDAYREVFGLLGDPELFEHCWLALAEVVALVRAGAPPLTIGLAADAAAEEIVAAVRRDPDGAPDLIDLLEGVADVLTETPQTQFCVPHVLIALALLFAKDGEPEAGMELLDSTIDQLNEAFNAGISPILVARNLALAWCAKSDLHRFAGETEPRLLAAKRSWKLVQLAEPAYQHFVLRRYCCVLREQVHPREAIEAATFLNRTIQPHSASIEDWLISHWPGD